MGSSCRRKGRGDQERCKACLCLDLPRTGGAAGLVAGGQLFETPPDWQQDWPLSCSCGWGRRGFEICASCQGSQCQARPGCQGLCLTVGTGAGRAFAACGCKRAAFALADTRERSASPAPTRPAQGCSTHWSVASSTCTSRPCTSASTRSPSSTLPAGPPPPAPSTSRLRPSRARSTPSAA